MTTEGTVLALDWGLKKVGYATGDGLGRAVTPRGRWDRKDPPGRWRLGRHDIEALSELVERFEIAQIVLGWPQSEDPAAKIEFETFRARLEAVLKRPVSAVDEGLTSWEVRRTRFEDEDAAAAALILEDYFAQRRPLAGGLLLGLALVLAIAGFAGASFVAWSVYVKPVSPAGPDVMVDVKPGTSLSALGAQLRAEGLNAPNWALRVWAATTGAGQRLQPGEFQVAGGASVADFMAKLIKGPQVSRRITIKEGHNIFDIDATLRETFPGAPKEMYWGFITNPERLEKVGVRMSGANPAPRATLEGFLFPETYVFRKYDPPKLVLEQALRQFESRALPILKAHPTWGQTPEGRYRLLTLASIVEKESGNREEQPLIASVFWNRLAKKMKLQSDPTTIYGLLPDFDGNLRKTHLLTPSPYNTYTLPELPAGPIANPGETALRAVLNPAFTDYLFFISRNDGTHVFSKDYATHNQYVQEFQVRRRRAPTPGTGNELAKASSATTESAPQKTTRSQPGPQKRSPPRK